MAIVRIGGAGVGLPTFPGLVNNPTPTASPGSQPAGFYTGLTNAVTLAAGETFTFPPGTFWVTLGNYTYMQWLDPVNNRFKNWATGASQAPLFIDSDGQNFRLANLTGCAVGANITAIGTAGVGVTTGIGTTQTGLTVTVSSGSSKWVPIIGGAISATIATSTGISTAGAGYNFIPTIVIDAPPLGGLQATALVTSLSSGTIPAANIQVINQGAGYLTAPNVTVVPDPREAAAATPGPTNPGLVVTSLTATGTLTGLYPSDHGTALTGVPTLTFSTGTGAATVIMNFCVTAFTTGTGGSSMATTVPIQSIANMVATQASPAPVNPLHSAQMTMPRPCRISSTPASGVIAVSTTANSFEDNGLGIEQVPTLIAIPSYTSTTGVAAALTAVVGGVSDTSYIQPV